MQLKFDLNFINSSSQILIRRFFFFLYITWRHFRDWISSLSIYMRVFHRVIYRNDFIALFAVNCIKLINKQNEKDDTKIHWHWLCKLRRKKVDFCLFCFVLNVLDWCFSGNVWQVKNWLILFLLLFFSRFLLFFLLTLNSNSNLVS